MGEPGPHQPVRQGHASSGRVQRGRVKRGRTQRGRGIERMWLTLGEGIE